MRCDLHVHTRHSGPANIPLLPSVGRECYSEPGEVYETALRRGMDLVTITDHDTIDGALQIAGRDEVFVSEEVTVGLPEGRELHLGVFDISEANHSRIGRLRRDPEALFAYLAEEGIPFCVNHPFSPLTGHREIEDFHLVLAHARLVEARNGMMPEATNEFAFRAARAAGLAPVGGSDAHTVAAVARAYTIVPRAQSKREFLEGLRRGLTAPCGRDGSYARLTSDVARIVAGTYREGAGLAVRSVMHGLCFALMVLSVPILGLLPLVTLATFIREKAGAARYYRRFQASVPGTGSIRQRTETGCVALTG